MMAQISRSSHDHSLATLEFEMALEIAEADALPPIEAIRKAAQSSGGDLVVALPAPSGDGLTGVVRLTEDGRSHFVQVQNTETGFAVLDERDMDSNLLGLARASAAVLEQLKRKHD
jgi:deferrochelatase/peroxidase EfeB